MHSVYVLWSKKDKNLYVGYSSDIKKRIAEHNKGRVVATKDRRPLVLVCCEQYMNRKDAMRREKYLKTGWGRRYLRKALKDTLRAK